MTEVAEAKDRKNVTQTRSNNEDAGVTTQAIGPFPMREGNRIDGLRDGTEAFLAMLDAIDEARSTVFLESYIFWGDEVGERFGEALTQAARRGIKVRVIVDDVGSNPLTDELVERLRRNGVEFRFHRPFRWWNLVRSNHRTHRKLMTVDGELGFIGGVGVSNDWSGSARTSEEWRDNHYRVKGPVVADMQALFCFHWDRESTDPSNKPPPGTAGSVSARLVIGEPWEGVYEMDSVVRQFIADCHQSLRIACPYFIPGKEVVRLIKDRARSGVKVEILTAGERTDKRIVRHASRHLWADLIEAGVEIHEFEPTLYHVKALIGDDERVLIGSANLDERSMKTNDEASLLVDDAEFADDEVSAYRLDLGRSRKVSIDSLRDRSLWTRLKDRMAFTLRPLL